MMRSLFFILCVLFTSVLLNTKALAAANHAPSFIGGAVQTFSVCENSGVISIDSFLAVIDSDAGQLETWTVIANASHGTLVASDTATSTDSIIVPSGLTYIPASGYSGTDSFTVQISDGIDTTTTTLYVTILPLPSAGTITGPGNVCLGTAGIVLRDSAAGGTWHATNSLAAVSGTVSVTVTGVSAGTDSIIYTVVNSCGTASVTRVVTVTATPHSGPITGADSLCSGKMDTLADAVAGGAWYSSNYLAATINSDGVLRGFFPDSTVISYIVTNVCGSDTAKVTIKVQAPIIPGGIIAPDSICQFAIPPTILIDVSPGGTWSSSNPFVAAVIGPALEGITPGTATITYTLINACGSATTTQNVTVKSQAECAAGVSIVARAKEPGIELLPNPNNGVFTFNLSSAVDEQAQVVITNVTGLKVKEFTTGSNNETPIELNVPAGMYFITASAQSGRYTTRFVVR